MSGSNSARISASLRTGVNPNFSSCAPAGPGQQRTAATRTGTSKKTRLRRRMTHLLLLTPLRTVITSERYQNARGCVNAEILKNRGDSSEELTRRWWRQRGCPPTWQSIQRVHPPRRILPPRVPSRHLRLGAETFALSV